MMPPKKSKAARASKEVEENKEELPKDEVNGTTEEAEESKPDKVEDDDDNDEEEAKEVNVFEPTILEGKRERTKNPSVAKLEEWMVEHLEEKENVRYSMGKLYEAFLEECIRSGMSGMEDYQFRKYVSDNFPKGFGIKEGSKYSSEIKPKKEIKKREKIQGDTFKLKQRDVLETTFKDLGNPRVGIRFSTVRTFIAGKYPALRVDMRPNYVKNALENGLRYGYVELLRGVGRSGVYRWYVEGEESEDEEPATKTKVKTEKKTDGEKTEDAEDKDEKSESANDETKEGDAEGEADGDKEEKKEGEDEKKEDIPKKKKKKTVIPASRQGKIVHSTPERIEDTFPLAITFGNEPKQASVKKIANYISEYYPGSNVDSRLKACLEKGAEKGFWEKLSGVSYQLTIDEFDPTDDDDMIGKVVNAIMACSEPKQCSASLLKNYVVEFHPAFKVADKMFRFKKALERAELSRDLIRLSGIGASGSFQLAYTFNPSPAVLAAQDTPSDYEEETDDETIPDIDSDTGEAALTAFQDAYVPRPSKRRGKARESAKHGLYEREAEKRARMQEIEMDKSRKRKATAKKSGRGKSRAMGAIKRKTHESSSEEEESSSEEESEEEEVAPSPKRGRKGVVKKTPASKAKAKAKSPAKKGRGRPPGTSQKAATKKRSTPSTDLEDSEEELPVTSDDAGSEYDPSNRKRKLKTEEDTEHYKPRPSASRGGRARTPPPPKTPKAKGKSKSAAKATPEPKVEKKGGRGRPSKTVAAKKAPLTKAALKEKPAELSDSDDEMPLPKGRGGRGRKNEPTTPRGRPRPSYTEMSDDEDRDSPPPKISKSTPKARGGRGKAKIEPSEDECEESPPPPKIAKSTPKGRGGKGKAIIELSDEEEKDEDSPPPPPKIAKSTPKAKGGKGKAKGGKRRR